ncbi:hypothetical protein ACWD4G_07170 [Streptomyces sp. NPDC002643]
MSIVHALLRWVLGVLAPGTGRRRADCRLAPPVPKLSPEVLAAAVPQAQTPRSPYGLDDGPHDGSASPLVRPYLVAVEREQARQARRRMALVLAADFGIDLDRHVVGAEAVVGC